MALSPPAVPPLPQSSGIFRAFADPSYRRLWVANVLLYTSRWMQMTLLGWFVLELTDSPWYVALVGFFSTAPMLLLGLVGGVLADRVARQRLLLLTQGINSAASALLMLVLCLGEAQVWQIYLAVLINGICWALDFPSRRALIYDLLGTAGITNAMALDSVGMNGSRMVGPTLAGVLITVVGVAGGYILITVCYVVAFGLLWSLSVPATGQAGRRQQHILRNLAEGFRYIRRQRVILATVGITVIMNFLLFSYMQMVPIIARDELHIEPMLLGALQAAEGLGALIGAILIASSASVRYHGRLFVGGSLLAFLALFLFSLSRWYVLSWPLLLCLGFGTSAFGTMQSTIVMLKAHEEMRGRALGVLSLAIGSGPLGALWIGAVGSAVHPVFAVRINALLGIITTALVVILLPTIMDHMQARALKTPPRETVPPSPTAAGVLPRAKER